MKIYHNPRCTKSRETLKILEDEGKKVQVIEYLKDTPGESELKEILKKLKIPAEKLVRKSEPVYKEKFRGKTLSEDEWISAMIANPKLIERPIVISGRKAVIGRPPENVRALF